MEIEEKLEIAGDVGEMVWRGISGLDFFGDSAS
jgi:hypothetical protein